MDRARDILRNGAWLTRERIRLVAGAVLFTSGVGLIYLLVTANGLVDSRDGRWERTSQASTPPARMFSTAIRRRRTT